MAATLALVAHIGSAASQDMEYRRIPVDEYVDKMTAGWVGQMVGVGLTKATEFRHMGELVPDGRLPIWVPEMVNQFDQDELYIEISFLRTLEQHGLDVSTRQAGIDFANCTYRMWRGNELTRNNLRNGIAPPDSGHPRFNGHADDTDYQIESDFSGLISPGSPNNVVRLGETFGRIMAYDGGLYGGLFTGGMYAEAFFETDAEKIVRAGLRCIPEGSQYHECISDVLKCYREDPVDWVKTWEHINARYLIGPEYQPFSVTVDRITAKIHGAYDAIGLLYGGGDIEKTLAIAARCGCGMDADYYPSIPAGILFTTQGMSNLPERFTSVLSRNAKFTHSDYDLERLAKACEKLAWQAVENAGGRIEQETNGRDAFVIPVEDVQPGKLEKCWGPGPIADSRFTEEERGRIRYAAADRPDMVSANLNDSIRQFAQGWKVSNCLNDMRPGLYGKVRGKENVLLTHPLGSDTACVLSRRVKVPAMKKTTLRLTVSHHVQGDWTLVVKANDDELLETPVGPETTENGWMDVAVDLSKYEGQEIELELLNQPSGWAWEAGYWAEVQLRTK
jgi:hypothetical protein